MKKDEFGIYEIFLPNNANGTPAIEHNTKVKVRKKNDYYWLVSQIDDDLTDNVFFFQHRSQ